MWWKVFALKMDFLMSDYSVFQIEVKMAELNNKFKPASKKQLEEWASWVTPKEAEWETFKFDREEMEKERVELITNNSFQVLNEKWMAYYKIAHQQNQLLDKYNTKKLVDDYIILKNHVLTHGTISYGIPE